MSLVQEWPNAMNATVIANYLDDLACSDSQAEV